MVTRGAREGGKGENKTYRKLYFSALYASLHEFFWMPAPNAWAEIW